MKSKLQEPKVGADAYHVYHQYTVLAPTAMGPEKRLMTALSRLGSSIRLQPIRKTLRRYPEGSPSVPTGC